VSPRRSIRCGCCGTLGRHWAHGWVTACYDRWLRAGKPEGGPPPPWSRPYGRREDYAELTREQGFTLYQAAERLGVSSRTAWRYERLLRESARDDCAPERGIA
jgi:hypothetical protein